MSKSIQTPAFIDVVLLELIKYVVSTTFRPKFLIPLGRNLHFGMILMKKTAKKLILFGGFSPFGFKSAAQRAAGAMNSRDRVTGPGPHGIAAKQQHGGAMNSRDRVAGPDPLNANPAPATKKKKEAFTPWPLPSGKFTIWREMP